MSTRLNYDIVEHVLQHAAADPDLTQDHAKELFKTAVHYRMTGVKKIIVPQIDACSPKKAAEKGQTDLLEWWRTSGKPVHWNNVMIWAAVAGQVGVLEWLLDHSLLTFDVDLMNELNFHAGLAGHVRVFKWLDDAGFLRLAEAFHGGLTGSRLELLKWCHGHKLFPELCAWDKAALWAVECHVKNPEEHLKVLEWIDARASDEGCNIYPKIIPTVLNNNDVGVIKWLRDKGVTVKWSDMDWGFWPPQFWLGTFLKHPDQMFVPWETIAEEYRDDLEAIEDIICAGAQVDWDHLAGKYVDQDDQSALKVLGRAGAPVHWGKLRSQYLDNNLALKSIWRVLMPNQLGEDARGCRKIQTSQLARWIADQL